MQHGTITGAHAQCHADQLRMHNTASTSSQSTSSQGTSSTSIDPKEAAKFASLAAHWWDPTGPFAPLLRMNPTRCKFIRDAVCAVRGLEFSSPQPLAGLRVLDVGCGGGILSESMARLGADVHGIDITHENVQAASSHARLDPAVAARVRCAGMRACLHASMHDWPQLSCIMGVRAF